MSVNRHFIFSVFILFFFGWLLFMFLVHQSFLKSSPILSFATSKCKNWPLSNCNFQYAPTPLSLSLCLSVLLSTLCVAHCLIFRLWTWRCSCKYQKNELWYKTRLCLMPVAHIRTPPICSCCEHPAWKEPTTAIRLSQLKWKHSLFTYMNDSLNMLVHSYYFPKTNKNVPRFLRRNWK